jgi:hypothetical protein
MVIRMESKEGPKEIELTHEQQQNIFLDKLRDFSDNQEKLRSNPDLGEEMGRELTELDERVERLKAA